VVTVCCLFTTLVILGPRAAIFLWWLVEPARWSLAFDTFIWPFLGFLFLPWLTLAFVIASPGGIEGFDWILLGLAFLMDIMSYGGGAFGNRDRVQSYYR